MKRWKRVKVKKLVAIRFDSSSWIGSMKDTLKIHGDRFSTGAWPGDEELEASYGEQEADVEAEAEAFDWIEGTEGDVADDPADWCGVPVSRRRLVVANCDLKRICPQRKNNRRSWQSLRRLTTKFTSCEIRE